MQILNEQSKRQFLQQNVTIILKKLNKKKIKSVGVTHNIILNISNDIALIIFFS